MTLDPSRVQAVFLAALEQETLAKRAAALDRECAADDELRRRVEALLIAHDRQDSLLDHPFVVPSEQGTAIRAQRAVTTDEIKPPFDDSERTR